METPDVHDTRWDKVEEDVARLFAASDVAIFGLYNKIIEAGHTPVTVYNGTEEENNGNTFNSSILSRISDVPTS